MSRGKLFPYSAAAHYRNKRHKYNTSHRYVAWWFLMIERIRLRLAQKKASLPQTQMRMKQVNL